MHFLKTTATALLLSAIAASAFSQTVTPLAVKNASGTSVNLSTIADPAGSLHYQEVIQGLNSAGGPQSATIDPTSGGLVVANPLELAADNNILTQITAMNAKFAALNGDGGALAHVTNFPSTQAVSIASLPIPTGAATSALQTTGNTSLSTIATNTTGLALASGQAAINGDGGSLVHVTNQPSSMAVTGAVSVSNLPSTQAVSGSVSVSNFPSTQAITASSLPLPSGAATAALQVTEGGNVATIAANSATQATAANQTISNASLATIATNTAGLATATLQTAANSSLATLATASASQATAANQATANSSLATIATASGTQATAANQATGNTSLASIVTNTAASATSALQSTGNSSLATIATNTSGSATSALQATGNASLATIATASGTQATAANQATGNTALASIVTNTAASATSALQATGNTALASIASNTSGVASAANQTATQGSVAAGVAATKSTLAGAVYNASAPSLSNGQQVALQTDSTGKLLVNTGAASTTVVTYNSTPPTLTNAQISGLQGDANANLNVNVQVSALPNGAATSANQASEISNLSTVIAEIGTTSDAYASGYSGSFSEIALLKGIVYQLVQIVTNQGNATTVNQGTVPWDVGAGSAGTPSTHVATMQVPTSNIVSGVITTAMNGTAPTQLLPAPGAGLRNYVTDISCENTSTSVSTLVDVQDGSVGAVISILTTANSYGGHQKTLMIPLKQPTLNAGLYVTNETSGANVKCSAIGYTGP